MSMGSKDRKNFISSVRNSLNGLNYIMANEVNFKREIILGILALVVSYFLRVSKIEFIIIIVTISLVLVAEIFNTGVERIVDLYTKEYNEIAKVAKDVSAFAVLLMCMFALVIGMIIFVPKIYSLIL